MRHRKLSKKQLRAMFAKGFAKENSISNDSPYFYGGRDYTNSIESAIQKARTEYEYPSDNLSQGQKQVLGRDYYRQLIEDKIVDSNIPNELKIKLGINSKRIK